MESNISKIYKTPNKQVIQSLVENISLFGTEKRSLKGAIRNRISTVELDDMRRYLSITRKDKLSQQIFGDDCNSLILSGGS